MFVRKNLVVVRGAGELGSAVIHRLVSSGIPVVALDCDYPRAVRRNVAFCACLCNDTGSFSIEGIDSLMCKSATECIDLACSGKVAVLCDPTAKSQEELAPNVLVDAIMAKGRWDAGTNLSMAPLVVGLGPGFLVGENCHIAIETHRGHMLGRIYEGVGETPLPFDRIPGNLGNVTVERVLRAPCPGRFVPESSIEIGSRVKEGDVIGFVGEEMSEVRSKLSGILRGLINSGTFVAMDQKIGDVDCRPEIADYHSFQISDKARCISGAVLQVVVRKMMSDQ